MLQEQLERLIESAEQGDSASREQLFAVLYEELHRLAQRELRRGGGSVLISPTTLLHETYIKLSGVESSKFPDHARFLAYAAQAMRRLIIDYVRNRRAQKRGAGFSITSLPTEDMYAEEETDLEGIGEALAALGGIEPRLAHVVDLKFFCGFSFAEIAGLMGVSERTAQRDWDKARILLKSHLTRHGPAASGGDKNS